MQLIVVGMHRSGTSAVTRLLNMAGAYFGPEGSATRANEENPKGFWERRDVRQVCDGILQGAGFDWWRMSRFDLDAVPDVVRTEHVGTFREIVLELDAHRPWVLKEPRFSVVLPLLRPLLEVPVCIHVTREPLEVASSLASRNDFPLSVCTALWELYMLRGVQATRGLPRYHLPYEDLLEDPVTAFGRLLDWLETVDVLGLRRPSEREVTAFMDPALHRHRRTGVDRAGVLNVQQAELAASIDAGALLTARWDTQEVSEGAIAALAEHEAHVDALDRARDALTDQARAAAEREEAASERFDARVRDIEHAIDHGLDDIEHQLHSIEHSRAWRTAQQAMYARQRINPGVKRPEPRRIDKVLRDLDQLRRVASRVARTDRDDDASDAATVERLSNGIEVRRAGPAPAARNGRPKVAVISWDVGHNPLGRAYTMAEVLSRRFDVEVWGAQFDRYGRRLWAPLRRPDLPIYSFDGRSLPEHVDVMEAVAERIDADAIWVSKPRFPSLALGVLAKRVRNRPLVLDVDDHELAFFTGAEHGLSLAELGRLRRDDLLLPFERAWTRACEPMISHADDTTVSNVALQERYGGTLVPHARDERRFDPERYDRDAIRAEMGLGIEDRLVLFGGTVRAHKGVVELLQALETLGDPRYKLGVFATPELDQLRDVDHLERWMLRLPPQPFDRLPAVLAASDLSCVLQDPTHPVSRYQLPAKVVDALAMGVPCLATATPPLQPLIDAGVVHVHERSRPLHERIAEVANATRDDADATARGRALFLEQYSCAAVAERVAPLFEQLVGSPPPLPATLDDLVATPTRLLGRRPATTPGGIEAQPAVPAHVPGARRWRASPGEQYDLVVFWRQNDTSIYGRRQDMLLKYLQRTGRFGTIVHFDHPISPGALARSYFASSGRADQRHLVVQQTLQRLLHQRDQKGVVHRTFLYGNKRSVRAVLPQRTEYEGYVSSVLAKHGVGKRLTVFWVYPTNEHFPALADALSPDLVVADVVDDNRTWYRPGSHHHARIDRNYRDILARSDVVLANCAPVAEGMQAFAPDVHVVANGCEMPEDDLAGLAPPRELAALRGPIVGYVGNLSDRIDIDLLDDLARARPEWNFVFVGSAHLDQSILRLDRHPNVHFVGVKPYDQAKAFIAHFDVALIPHLDNEMTRSMNPLKAFVYCAAGVPVVSTPIANMEELGDLIIVAKGVDGFVAAIDEAIEGGRRGPDLEQLAPHSWERRVEQIMELIDDAAGAHEPR